jgi:hypothetical protein
VHRSSTCVRSAGIEVRLQERFPVQMGCGADACTPSEVSSRAV